MHSFLVRRLLGVCAALGPVVLFAAEPAPKTEPTPPAPPAAEKTKPNGAPAAPGATPAPPAAKPATATDADVLNMPKMEVTASRVKELDRTIKKLDKAIAREKKNMKASDLDKALNSEKLSKAASLFGGNSAAHMENVAATRVMYMEAERDLLIDLKQPRTLDEYNMLQSELVKVREMQRELDKANH